MPPLFTLMTAITLWDKIQFFFIKWQTGTGVIIELVKIMV